jgi:hypothetical protein
MFVLLMGLMACGETVAEEPVEKAPAEVVKEEPAEKPADKAGKATAIDCNATAYTLQGKVGEQTLVKCPAGCASGSVWGDDRYTPDSKICAAAIHTGAITADGGKAMVMFKPKMGDFKAASKNGVDSHAWTTEYEPTVVIKGKHK